MEEILGPEDVTGSFAGDLLGDFALQPILLAYLAPIERGRVKWHHWIDKDSLKFKELEHVRIEKAGQLFRDMLS